MNINLEDILAWDIETVPTQEFNDEHSLFATWKNRNRKEDLTTEELIDKFNSEGGLFGEYLTIVCISCAFIHNGEIRINSFTGEEKEIIDSFLKAAEFVQNRSLAAGRKGLINLGHNILNYDISVTRKVYSRYYPMFTYPDYISDLDTKSVIPQPQKPWVLAERNIDTLQLQKGANYMFSSMAEVAINLGLPSPKLDTDGSQVAALFREGKLEAIRLYCENDVLTSLKIVFSWLGQQMLEVVKKEENLKNKSLTIFQRINQTKSISEKDKIIIKKLLGKQSEKDKEITLNLLKASLAEIDPNFGKIINEKEIEEKIKNLQL
jgi:predicted PolB exonuclease-like 3'-5' exonuclease